LGRKSPVLFGRSLFYLRKGEEQFEMKDIGIQLLGGIFFLLGLMYGDAYRYADWSVIIYVF